MPPMALGRKCCASTCAWLEAAPSAPSDAEESKRWAEAECVKAPSTCVSAEALRAGSSNGLFSLGVRSLWPHIDGDEPRRSGCSTASGVAPLEDVSGGGVLCWAACAHCMPTEVGRPPCSGASASASAGGLPADWSCFCLRARRAMPDRRAEVLPLPVKGRRLVSGEHGGGRSNGSLPRSSLECEIRAHSRNICERVLPGVLGRCCASRASAASSRET